MPSIKISPRLTGRSRLRQLSNVVLPEPLGPVSAIAVPDGTSSETPSRMVRESIVKLMSWAVIRMMFLSSVGSLGDSSNDVECRSLMTQSGI